MAFGFALDAWASPMASRPAKLSQGESVLVAEVGWQPREPCARRRRESELRDERGGDRDITSGEVAVNEPKELRKLPKGMRWHRGKIQVRYYGSDGQRRSDSFARLTDAKRFQNEIEVDKARGQWLDPRGAQVPFDEWAWTHLASRHRLGAAKRASVESVMRRHVVGGHGFGTTPLGRITTLSVQRLVNLMVDAGYSGSYIRGAYTTLSGILRAAAAAKLIREAPTSGIELPAPQRKRERFLSEPEIDRLVECLTPSYRPLVFTAAWAGLRWGELAGLRREHLDLDRGQLRVRAVLTRFGLKDCPKSDSARRTIGLPRSVVVALQDHLDGASEGEHVSRPAPGRCCESRISDAGTGIQRSKPPASSL